MSAGEAFGMFTIGLIVGMATMYGLVLLVELIEERDRLRAAIQQDVQDRATLRAVNGGRS